MNSRARGPGRAPSEHEIQQRILYALGSRTDVTVWRNNVGAARAPGGGLVRFGLPGSADILGFLHPSGRFLAVEVKSATGRLSPKQQVFRRVVEAGGGLFIVARTVDDAISAVNAAQEAAR